MHKENHAQVEILCFLFFGKLHNLIETKGFCSLCLPNIAMATLWPLILYLVWMYLPTRETPKLGSGLKGTRVKLISSHPIIGFSV
jgi:hypothetical protein